jgi:hypothetical protein
MTATIKIFFFIAFLCSMQSTCRSGSSTSSGEGYARQTCPDGYYCPSEKQCKTPRSNRCTSSQNCPGLDSTCYKERNSNRYRIRIGHARLTSSGSKRTIFEHRFLLYRGYAYEFGKSYPQTQELDIADPIYKYKNGRGLNSGGITNYVYSYCSYDDANMFVNGWKNKYNLIWRNCQNFVRGMKHYLKRSSCNRPSLKRDASHNMTDVLTQEINAILSNCSIVCCDTNGTSDASTNDNSAYGAFSIPVLLVLILFLLLLIIPVVFFIFYFKRKREKLNYSPVQG